MGFLDKLFGKSKNNDANASAVITESAPLASTQTSTKPKKPRKPKTKKETKVEEPKVQPHVKVVNFEFDPLNPRLGSMELEWNPEFVDLLKTYGYNGDSSEQIVDNWLTDVCRNIAANSDPTNNVASFENSRYISRKRLDDGRSEIS